MAEIKGITIGIEIDDKSKLKLRAIAKHVGALADELDAIEAMNDDELPTRMECSE